MQFFRFFKNEITLIPFLKSFKNYRLEFLKKDFFASLSIALLAIPQSIAYSLLAGLPPTAGLFSAIFGTAFTSLMGSSKHLVSGPTTAVSILIQTVTAQVLFEFYPTLTGDEKTAVTLQILMHIVLIIGITQILFALLNMGKLLQFVSRSVVLGYLAGVVIAIVINQLYYVFGLSSSQEEGILIYRIKELALSVMNIRFMPFFISLISFAFLVFFKKRSKILPYPLLMIILVSSIVFFFNRWTPFSVSTLHTMNLPSVFSLRFIFPSLSLALFQRVFFAALAISLLALLEVFSVSRAISAKTGDDIKTNQEVFAVGISNLILGFVKGAMPASGSLSRSLLNIESKGKTRIAPLLSGGFVAFLAFFAWPLIGHIPLSSLGAMLIFMVPALIDKDQLKLTFSATRGDAVVFLLTFVSCFLFRLDVAFFIGIVISLLSFLRKMATLHLMEYAFDPSGRLAQVYNHKKIHRKIRIIGIGGELFFAAVDIFQNAVQTIASEPYVRVIILRLQNVYYVDASMCFAILRLHEYLKSSNRHLLISGISSDVWKTFLKAGLVDKLGRDHLFFADETKPQLSTWMAGMKAEEFIH